MMKKPVIGSGSIWFTADLHLGHKNIVRGCSEWTNTKECRNFDTLAEHDNEIIGNINKYVKEEDILYIIGDFSMGGRENVKKYRNLINCKTIHLIEGNHDTFIIKNAQFADGTFAHDLFTSVNNLLIKKIGKTNFVMCHYAFRSWPNGSRGCIMLHGHNHDNLPPYEKLMQIADDPYLVKTDEFYKTQDCGIEVALRLFGEMRPFSMEEIKNIMETRINLDVDYH